MKKMMKFLFAALGMASSALAFSQENTPAGLTAPTGIVEPPASSAAQEQHDAPRTVRTELSLRRLANGDVAVLNGLQNVQTLEFTLRKDQVVTQAHLDLAFTPSPALLSKLSHIRVYLNEEMMGVVPVDETAPGTVQSHRVGLDPLYLTSFNRLRLEFVGHYTNICEDLAHTSLWLDLSQKTRVVLDQQALPVVNDLAFFPEPFLDLGDMNAQSIPFMFQQLPDAPTLQAASVLSSFLGSRAAWRVLEFPTLINSLPAQGHAVVFADNDHRPDILKDYPKVDAPTVELISVPDNPTRKLLLVLGRDSADLLTAAQALALGNPLFRGQSVTIKDAVSLQARKPYDAPNWTPTDRPDRFSELVEYPGQLEVSGLRPAPITLRLNLPPDLFVWRNNGIPMQVRYRYTPPASVDESRLSLSLNNRFVDSYLLNPQGGTRALSDMRLPLLSNDSTTTQENLLIPALKIGAHNQLRFDFSFAALVGSSQPDRCQTMLPVDTRAAIDENSHIDFSGYRHYLEMPNLQAFAMSGFPFSKMADLSETLVVLPAKLNKESVSTVLELMGHIGAQVGYPAVKVRLSQDLNAAAAQDADVIWIGEMPEAARLSPNANLLLQEAGDSVKQPRQSGLRVSDSLRHTEFSERPEMDAVTRVDVKALAPLAAVVGMQSSAYPQRSWVGLLASTPEDYALLRTAFRDEGRRDAIQGSVALIRDSGVVSEAVGPRYFVGQLHWWQLVWFHLSDKPLLLAAVAALTVVLIALMLWLALRAVARRRLSKDA